MEDRWRSINKRRHESSWKEEAIGFVPKGLKKGSAACRWMERVDVDDRYGGSLPKNGSNECERRPTRLQQVSINEEEDGSVRVYRIAE